MTLHIEFHGHVFHFYLLPLRLIFKIVKSSHHEKPVVLYQDVTYACFHITFELQPDVNKYKLSFLLLNPQSLYSGQDYLVFLHLIQQ